MKTYKNLYEQVCNIQTLILAWRNARKGKTKKSYVIEFEKDLIKNLLNLQEQLKNKTYSPKSLKTFILRDPKTRRISKSAFIDRIVHHALILVIKEIFETSFIYDSHANQIGKGTLKAIKRFDNFKRKASKNNLKNCYVFKADIKHYFQEVNHNVLINIIKRKIKDILIIWLIKQILKNYNEREQGKGMPLGNLTSQFFANIYLNELDYHVKHDLKIKHYIRYVDDFIILHNSKKLLEIRKKEINDFLKEKLRLELHPDKSRIIPLSKGIDFVGFRNFYHFKLLRKRNLRTIQNKIYQYQKGELSYKKLSESFQGWNAYAKWSNSYKLRKELSNKIKLI